MGYGDELNVLSTNFVDFVEFFDGLFDNCTSFSGIANEVRTVGL